MVEGQRVRFGGVALDFKVGSAPWFAWLGTITAFTFVHAAGKFTAVKERTHARGPYWRAYLRADGRRFCAYLGRTQDLTPDRLASTARALVQKHNTARKDARDLQGGYEIAWAGRGSPEHTATTLEHAQRLIGAHRMAEARDALEALAQQLDQRPAPASAPRGAERQVRARVALLQAYLVHALDGDAERAVDLAERALALMQPREWEWRLNALLTLAFLEYARSSNAGRAYALCVTATQLALRHGRHVDAIRGMYLGAVYLVHLGQLKAAALSLARAERLAPHDALPAAEHLRSVLVSMRLAYEHDDLPRADALADAVLAASDPSADPLLRIVAVSFHVHCAIGLGHPADALRILEFNGQAFDWTLAHRMHGLWLRARALREMGDPSGLVKWIEATVSAAPAALRVPWVNTDPDVTRARAWLDLGFPDRAIAALDPSLERLQSARAMGAVIQPLALRARAQDMLGDRPGALDTLAMALKLGKAEGYARTFIDHGPAMRHLLLDARAHDIERRYVARLLTAFDRHDRAPDEAPRDAAGGAPRLTPREHQVLSALARGARDRDIARELRIAVTTVKSHTGAIYDKLGARSRTHAVARAHELGLCSPEAE